MSNLTYESGCNAAISKGSFVEIVEMIVSDISLDGYAGRPPRAQRSGKAEIEMLEMRADSVEATDQEKQALHTVQEVLSLAAVRPEAPAYLVGPNDVRIPLPEPLFRILRQAAGMLSRGQRITLGPVDKEMSTQEAADMLNMSRPHLVKLLDAGEIPFTKTGRNRRVMFGAVVQYMNKRKQERREHLREMIRRSEELGVYDMEEFAMDSGREG
jgi:excisionase family DNA binding protein